MSSIRSAATLLNGIPAFFFRSHFRVQGESMLPAFHHGDLLHVVPRSWAFGGYRRGDVVVAKSPAVPGEYWIKRVIGLPGEFITVNANGGVLIYDSVLSEPYVSTARTISESNLPWWCEGDEYFLMGDNRTDSYDSRRFGPVASRSIVGRVWLRWPARRLDTARGNPQ